MKRRAPSVEVCINGKRVGVVGFRAEGICHVGFNGDGTLVGSVTEVPRAGPDLERTWRFPRVKRADEVILRLAYLAPTRPDREVVDTPDRQLRTARAVLKRQTARRAQLRRQYVRQLSLPTRPPPKPLPPEVPTHSTHVSVDGELRWVTSAVGAAHVAVEMVLAPKFNGVPRIGVNVQARDRGADCHWAEDAPLNVGATIRFVTTPPVAGTRVVRRLELWPLPRTRAELRKALARLGPEQERHEEDVRRFAVEVHARRAGR